MIMVITQSSHVMTFSRIQAHIQTLKEEPIKNSVRNLKSDARALWRDYVIHNLSLLLSVHQEEPKRIEACRAFMTEVWHTIKGSCVCYTAQPDDEITHLLIHLAYLVDPDNPLKVLMPDVWQENLSNDYPHLNSIPVTEVFKTHILSENGTYLYPVSLITTIDLMTEKNTPPFNPYYNETVSSDPRLSHSEYKRLEMHSLLIESLFQVRAHYQKLVSDEGHLLGQLLNLVHELSINSVHSLGEEENAGKGAYPAIIHFNQYYMLLPIEEKNKIPPRLKQEIELLLTLSSNQIENSNATENMATCIATRKSHIFSEMIGKDELLSHIRLIDSHRHSLVQETRKIFESMRDELQHTLEKKTYTGNDALGVTLPLLKKIGLNIRIRSVEDIGFVVQGISAENLPEILSQKHILSEIKSQLSSVFDIITFIMLIPEDKLPAIFTSLGRVIFDVIKRPSQLGQMFISLQADKIKTILRLMDNHLFQIIENGNNLGCLFEELLEEQRVVIYEHLKDKLPSILKNGTQLRNVLKHLPVQEHDRIYENIKNNIPHMIKNSEDFGNLVYYLSSEQFNFSLQIAEEKLSSVIKGPYLFADLLKKLSPERCVIFCDTRKDLALGCFKNAFDLNGVLYTLDIEQCDIFCRATQEKIRAIMKSKDDFDGAFYQIPPEKRRIVMEYQRLIPTNSPASFCKNTLNELRPDTPSTSSDETPTQTFKTNL